MEGFICTVTAKAEQIPNTCTVTGLLLFKGSLSSFLFRGESKGSLGSFTLTGIVVVSLLMVSDYK
jgi:hypothetical protein